MKNTNKLIIIGLVIFLGLAVFLFTNLNSNNSLPKSDVSLVPTNKQMPTKESTESTDSTQPAKTYTMAEVETHNTPSDCWFVIDGKVYNASNFGEKHPGGDAVYAGCGKDATTLFNTRPMGSGTPHSDKARSNLPKFYVGDLSQ
jgi:cytochrome b involved in lipid metabolism